MSKPATVQIDGQNLRLSNLDKVLYPRSGFTKGQVIDYYDRIAEVMLPHLADRPLTLKRYPNGVDADFFFEKQCPSARPEWMPTASVPTSGSTKGRRHTEFCLIDSRAALVWVANLASLEMHVLLAKAANLDCPTAMVFDLDPGPPAGLAEAAEVALQLRDLLDRDGLQSLVKTSGGKGIHVYVPLNTPATYEQTKSFARALADRLAKGNPMVVTKMLRSGRRGKVLVDWGQNDRHKTTVCVYSLRAYDPPTVSTPLTWDELASAARRGTTAELVFDPAKVLRRVGRLGDLFAGVLTIKQRLGRK